MFTFSNSLNLLGIGIVVFDDNYVVKFCNENFNNIFNIKKLRENEIFGILPQNLIDFIKDSLDKTYLTPVKTELRFENGSEEEKAYQVLLHKEDGTYILTLRLKEQRHVKNANTAEYKLVDKLGQGIAHELNSPLDAVIRYVNLALDRIGDEGIIREYLLNAKLGLNRIVKVVNSIIRFSQDTRLHRLKKCDLKEAIDGALLLLTHRNIFQNIEIVKDLYTELPFVPFAEGGLEQVFTNLFKNAFDAMPDGGWLFIKAEVEGKLVKLEIRDTGIGIDEDIQDQIFEPFFTTKDIGEGSGLGLAITKELLQHSGCKIEIKSKVGVGTSFTLYFPMESAKTAVTV